MAKQKNIEMRQLISSEAFRLFIHEGYEGTTYKKIAESCNTSRPIIQYYFPKKRLLAVSFLERILELTTDYIEENNLKRNDPPIDVFLVAQIYYAFLLMNDDIKRFTLDIISSRNLTAELMSMNFVWARRYLNIPDESKDDEFFNDNLMIVGGFYELAFYYLENNRDFDLQRYLLKIVTEYLALFGETQEKVTAALLPHKINERELAIICTRLLNQF